MADTEGLRARLSEAPDDHRHHTVVRRVGGTMEVARPLRDASWWHRWKAERACRKTLGHCWHPMGFVDWFCCDRMTAHQESVNCPGSRGNR